MEPRMRQRGTVKTNKYNRSFAKPEADKTDEKAEACSPFLSPEKPRPDH